ncbi:MAG TPA: conjugative transposon protein TraJ [Puia sp.]|nr:conjugative transposon protein TraJ [Puia sp.]
MSSRKLFFGLGALLLGPVAARAQDSWASNISSLNGVLDQIYTQMLPLCSRLIGVGQGIAGFAALFYIAARVWRHLANAEPIDLFALFRPFVLGFCILIFPSVIGLMNGILQPTVSATSAMVNHSDEAIAALLAEKQAAIQQTDAWQMYVGENGEGDIDKWYQYTHPDDPNRADEGWLASIGTDVKFAMAKASYNFRNAIKEVIAEILQLLFAAASLCINTIRTFNLLLLAIIGPLVFGFSVFDGLQHTLKHWIARYINVFLWLPVANLFGAIIGQIQQNMLKIDIAQINTTGDTFFSSTDVAYLIFLIIGIFGYTTVPGVANQIIWVSGDSLTSTVTKTFRKPFS